MWVLLMKKLNILQRGLLCTENLLQTDGLAVLIK